QMAATAPACSARPRGRIGGSGPTICRQTAGEHMERFPARLVPALGAFALVLAACGSSSSSSSSTSGGSSASGSSSGGAANLSSCSGTVTVASDLPTSGGDASIGGGTEKG